MPSIRKLILSVDVCTCMCSEMVSNLKLGDMTLTCGVGDLVGGLLSLAWPCDSKKGVSSDSGVTS